MDEKEIKQINEKIKKKGAKWIATETPLSKLPLEERKKWLGSLPEEPEEKKADTEEADITLGSSWDWRNAKGSHNWTTPVKTQCGCGSCVAFGTIGAMECFLKILRNSHASNPNFSEAHLFFCNNRQCNPGDPRYGWGSSSALNYLKSDGVPDDACFVYGCPADNQPCNTCSNWRARATKITKWKSIGSKNDMKKWLSSKGPLVASYTVYQDFFSYSSGVYEHVSGGVAGGHCVAVVGYNDTNQCWICKNSWGGSWGESGYFRIKYGECNIDNSMKAIEGIKRQGWQNGKKIIGLWAINEKRNAWVLVRGLGWRKLANNSDTIVVDLMLAAAHAKAHNRNVNFYEDGVEGGTIVIKQIYVW